MKRFTDAMVVKGWSAASALARDPTTISSALGNATTEGSSGAPLSGSPMIRGVPASE
jgi:hypothetical protein